MSWFSDVIDQGSNSVGGGNINWNPSASPVWANTSADPTKGTFGTQATQATGGLMGAGLGGPLGSTAGSLLGIDPVTGSIIGTILGAKWGSDNAVPVAKVPFVDDAPKNNTTTPPSTNTITTNVAGQKGQAARALEENLRSQKRGELPKNIEQTFNLESSLNKAAGNKGV